jgi:hypothetical protein
MEASHGPCQTTDPRRDPGAPTHLRIMFRHILPNIIGPLVVVETLAIPGYISLEAFLHWFGYHSPNTLLGGDDFRWGRGCPHLSKPGDLPCSGISDHHVCFQFPGRWIARCPRATLARQPIRRNYAICTGQWSQYLLRSFR